MTKDADKGRRRQLQVINSEGTSHRFLRGMITHDLVQRGLSFEDAYAVARAIRGTLLDREEITTAEIRDLIEAQVEKVFGSEVAATLRTQVRPSTELRVLYDGQKQLFSRGLLARSINAAGVDLDKAYALVNELEGDLRADGLDIIPSAEIARRTDELIEGHVGRMAAKQYRLVRRIRTLPRPLVIYLGGASGTGKSSLALELAPLLRIYQVNATDTIRQVMRMVFTPSIMPALHKSSFEVAAPLEVLPAEDAVAGTPGDPEYAQRLVASFEEQASRVCVGVRAVVERAIAENNSIIVEGVHLHPAIVPFSDLEGSAYQVPLVLATLNEETHRARFLARSKSWGRRAERYLEQFGSIRAIHDYLLQQAEANEVQEVDTSEADPSSGRTLRLVTAMVEKRVPSMAMARAPERQRLCPTLLLVIDGLADRPVRALGGRTPLQAADTPTLDRLAMEGRCGLADAVSPGVVPDTAAGTLAVLGQSPLALKRGPVEAVGAGLSLSPSDIALRGNLATVDEHGMVIDRRAGRIRAETDELAQAIDRLPLPRSVPEDVEVRVAPSTEHRLAIVLKGQHLSSEIAGSDPGDGSSAAPALIAEALDPNNRDAVFTARILALFEQEARRVLDQHPINAARREEGLFPANAILTRGAGRIHRLIPLEEAGMPLRLVCVSGDRTILGLCSWLGAEIVTKDGMTANLDTNLKLKFKEARDALRRSDLVLLQVKGADIAAHDRRPELKVEFLEKLDRRLGRLVDDFEGCLRVAVGSDHATVSESGQHAADPLPVLIWGNGIAPDEVERFDEMSVASGALQRFPLQLLLSRLYDLT
jgi:2,3-bisphosphoglycerate-independent phosphoglycerate mutase